MTLRASKSPYVPTLQKPTLLGFRPSCTPPSLPRESSMVETWTTIAQAIKQGPSLPKVELMKFSGDPLEYAEFATNFKDDIESQVSDESQRKKNRRKFEPDGDALNEALAFLSKK